MLDGFYAPVRTNTVSVKIGDQCDMLAERKRIAVLLSAEPQRSTDRVSMKAQSGLDKAGVITSG